MPTFENLKKQDVQVYETIENELQRQRNKIELIASENVVSDSVMEAMGSYMTNKYAEGYPMHRYYGGCECVDVVEDIARDRLKEIFGAEYANVQPHSGAQANMAVYFAILEPGDTVLGMNLSHGGHLSHGSKVNFSGKLYNFIPYGVDEKTGRIDYDEVEKWILEGRVDCGFLSCSTHTTLETFPVEQDEWVVILSHKHPLANASVFPMKALEEYPFLLMAKDNNTDIIDVLKENNLSLDIRLTTWDDYAIAASVEQDLGISVLPRLTLKRTPYNIVIKQLEKPVYREISFAVRELKTASQAVKRFMDYIQYRNL